MLGAHHYPIIPPCPIVLCALEVLPIDCVCTMATVYNGSSSQICVW
jgi:hypothetical protein